jgi:hypothetical protein
LNRGRGNSGGGHSPPYDWIPAPRFHEDKLRGNDPPEADRESEGVPQNPPESPFDKGGLRELGDQGG